MEWFCYEVQSLEMNSASHHHIAKSKMYVIIHLLKINTDVLLKI
jgi:hypothetical protein